MFRTHGISYVQMGLSMMIVGSLVTASKMTMEQIPPFLANEFRFLIASIIFLPMLVLKEGGVCFTENRPHQPLLFILSFSGTFLFNILLMYGVSWTTGVESGILTSVTPAAVGILSFLLLKERLGLLKITGILFVILGTGVIQIPGAEAGTAGQAPHPGLGNLLVLAAVFSEGLFITLGKKATGRVSPLYVSTMVSVYGVLLFLPGALWELRTFDWAEVTWGGWTLILYNGVIVTVVGFLLMYAGISRIPASSAGMLTALMPVSAVLFSAFFLKETITWVHGIGIFAVLTGMGFLAQEKNLHPSLKKQKRQVQ